MEIRQLKYFLAVADTRSFVSAAEKLYISRQAVSKSVAQLEEELKLELFMRDSGGAFLTPAGVMFYERVRTLVMELDSVKEQMIAYGQRYQQRIRIVFSVGTVRLLEERLLAYRDRQRNAEITYEEYGEDGCREQLLSRQADIAVTTQELIDPLFAVRVVRRSPFGILIREQRELQDVTVGDLGWIPLAGQNDEQTARFCEKHGLKLQYRGYDTRRLLELTVAGKCAMICPRCMAPDWLEGVRWIPIHGGGDWQLYGCYPRNIEKNMLYSQAVEELLEQVFSQEVE